MIISIVKYIYFYIGYNDS